jgi:hypothetical protein
VPFDQCLPFSDLGEGGNAAELEVADSSRDVCCPPSAQMLGDGFLRGIFEIVIATLT